MPGIRNNIANSNAPRRMQQQLTLDGKHVDAILEKLKLDGAKKRETNRILLEVWSSYQALLRVKNGNPKITAIGALKNSQKHIKAISQELKRHPASWSPIVECLSNIFDESIPAEPKLERAHGLTSRQLAEGWLSGSLLIAAHTAELDRMLKSFGQQIADRKTREKAAKQALSDEELLGFHPTRWLVSKGLPQAFERIEGRTFRTGKAFRSEKNDMWFIASALAAMEMPASEASIIQHFKSLPANRGK